MYLPSLQDINVYYESDTFTYPQDGYYVVRKGDTFKSIAELVYEDPNFADYIRELKKCKADIVLTNFNKELLYSGEIQTFDYKNLQYNIYNL